MLFDTTFFSMRLIDLSHTIELLSKKIDELQARHDLLLTEVDIRKNMNEQKQSEMAQNASWRQVMEQMQLNIDDCIAYLRSVYEVTLNICNNFWETLWNFEHQVFHLQNMLMCFDSDLYHRFFTASSQFCNTDVTNSIAHDKMQQFERMLEVQLNIDQILFKMLDSEMKLVETYAITDNDKQLHESFKRQFKELLEEMLVTQAKRIGIFDCDSMRPQYARFERVQYQVKQMKMIVACVNIDCQRVY